MTMHMTDPKIVAMLKTKYGEGKIMKCLNLYGYGIPEQYWFKETESHLIDIEDQCLQGLKQGENICIVGNDVTEINKSIAGIASKLIFDKKLGTKYVDYVTLMGQLVDKYGLMQTNVTKEWADYDIIAITGIRNYGRKFEQLNGIFTSVIDSTLNQVFKKQFIFGVELNDKEHKTKYDTDGSIDEHGELISTNVAAPTTDSETQIFEQFPDIYRLIKTYFTINQM